MNALPTAEYRNIVRILRRDDWSPDQRIAALLVSDALGQAEDGVSCFVAYGHAGLDHDEVDPFVGEDLAVALGWTALWSDDGHVMLTRHSHGAGEPVTIEESYACGDCGEQTGSTTFRSAPTDGVTLHPEPVPFPIAPIGPPVRKPNDPRHRRRRKQSRQARKRGRS